MEIMDTIKSDEFVILRLPPVNENKTFIFLTFSVTQYIFYDDRFYTKQLKDIHPDKFNKDNYNQFREKCLEIERKEISFTINEYFFLAKVIDFVSKCFIGDPNIKLKQVMTEDFRSMNDFNYNSTKDLYLAISTKFFNGFKDNCKNNKLLSKLEKELDWGTDI